MQTHCILAQTGGQLVRDLQSNPNTSPQRRYRKTTMRHSDTASKLPKDISASRPEVKRRTSP